VCVYLYNGTNLQDIMHGAKLFARHIAYYSLPRTPTLRRDQLGRPDSRLPTPGFRTASATQQPLRFLSRLSLFLLHPSKKTAAPVVVFEAKDPRAASSTVYFLGPRVVEAGPRFQTKPPQCLLHPLR
jgi:hypothetical protein